jgi:hypothetical protein
LSPDRNIHVLVTKRGADAFELDAPLIDISNADSVGDIIAFFDVDAVDPGYWCSPQGDHIDVVLEDTGVMRVFVTEKRGRYFGLGGRVSGVSLDRTLSGLVAEG